MQNIENQMNKYEQIQKNPKQALRLIGLKLSDFDLLLEKVQNYLITEKEKNPISQRGLKSKLSVAEQLILTLIYLKHYPTFVKLAFDFGICESHASKIFHKYVKILHKIIGLPENKEMSIKDCSKIIVDVTVQPIERPVNDQKLYYNGQRKSTVIKQKL